MNSNKLTPILDNGHGGCINGVYQTSGKRSPNWNHGVLYEGVANRWIVNKVIQKLDVLRLPYYHISPELEDVSLTRRCNRCNSIYDSNNNTYGVSIHFNAGKGTGWEVYTSPGITKSDSIADVFINNLTNDCRLKGRINKNEYLSRDKEKKFQILTKTKSPFILLELGFMDNKHDYELIFDEDYQNELANIIVKSIMSI